MLTSTHPVIAHIPSLRRYARGLTGGNVADADDLVQDTLERAYAKWHLYQPLWALRPWLFSIMHNLFINQISVRKQTVTTVSLDEASELGVAATQETRVHGAEILAALTQLPPDSRAVLLLVTVEEFTYAATAQILDIPVGTVMSRLARARAQLRALTETPTPKRAPREIRLVR